MLRNFQVVRKVLSFIPHTPMRKVSSFLPFYRLRSRHLNLRVTKVMCVAHIPLLICGIVTVFSFRPAFFPPLLLSQFQTSGRWPRLKCHLRRWFQPTVTSSRCPQGSLHALHHTRLLLSCPIVPSPRTQDYELHPSRRGTQLLYFFVPRPAVSSHRCVCKRPR